MDIFQLFSYSPLVIAVIYFLLLVVAFIRRQQTDHLLLWLLSFLGGSALWQGSVYLFGDPLGDLSTIPLTINVLSALILLNATGAYLDRQTKIYGFVLGALAVTGVGIADLFIKIDVSLPLPFLRLSGAVIDLALHLLWLIFLGIAYVWTIRNYRNSQFPWHANRYLFWANGLILVVISEIVSWIDSPVIGLIANLIRIVAASGFAYASATYIRFDVRARFRRIIVLLIIALTSALPAVGAFYLFTFAQERMTPTAAIIAMIVGFTALFALYQPYRKAIDSFVYSYLIGAAFQTNTLIRNYTKAISQTVDIDQLALNIFRQFNNLFEVRRGALMLVTKTSQGYEIEPIPAVGDLDRSKERLALHSPFIAALVAQRQPLLQYEIDFDPNYEAIRLEAQEWLRNLRMELYVPIRSGDELQGFIALGPKASGLTYRPNELEAVQLLADQTVVALQNALLYSELGHQNEKVRHLNDDLVQQNERLGTMDKVKSDFITIASHELRTPLTQIKGYSDILAAMNEENALTREQTREIVNHIERASTRLEGLISAMLDASQIDVDEMHLTFVATQIETVLRMGVEPLMRSMINRGLKYELHVPDNLPTIQADFKRLAQALRNILGNAVKYTPDGGSITVHINFLADDENQSPHLEIAVADTGIGIDKKNHELVFEKFFRVGDPQLHSTGNTKFMGAGPGLGLPIAKGVVEGHGGRIWVESAGEDKKRCPGSTFYIILPISPPRNKHHIDLPDVSYAVTDSGNLVAKQKSGEEEERPSWLIG